MARGEALPFVGVALVLLVGLAWGFNWPAIKIAVTEISPWTYRAVSLVVAALGMLGLARARVGRLRLPRREIGPIVVLALLNVTGFQMLVAFGLSMMEATRGVILGHTQPLWVVLLSAFILRETVSGARLWGLLLGLAAMALVIAPEARMLSPTPMGAFLVVAAAASWGLGTVLYTLNLAFKDIITTDFRSTHPPAPRGRADCGRTSPSCTPSSSSWAAR